jgi:pilus assembly protein CpaB
MERRTVMLVVAVVIALLGAGLVFFYVQGLGNQSVAAGTDQRVLVATAVIDPGETIAAAQAAGKIDFGSVPAKDVLDGAMTTTTALRGEIALTTIFPKEQIVSGKFGNPGQQEQLTIPNGMMAISVQLTDPARVAGFVVPGSQVSVFASGTQTDAAGTSLGDYTRLLLRNAEVIGVGQTTLLSTTTSASSGTQTTEQIPQTILTLAVDLNDAQKVLYAARSGDLAFGLLTAKSHVGQSSGITATNLFR